MKVSEILVENKQLNEWVFLAGVGTAIRIAAGYIARLGVTYAGITAALSALMAGWTVVEVVQVVSEIYKKLNKDPNEPMNPENLTDEDWEQALVDIMLALSTALGAGALKLLPQKLKKQLAMWLKNKITTRWKADNAADFAERSRGITDPKKLRELAARHRLANMKATKKADELIKKLPSKVATLFKVGIGLNIVHDYYKKISRLEEDWEAYQKGDMTTLIFKDAPEPLARKTYDEYKTKYLGELTVGISAFILAAPAAAISKAAAVFFGKTGGIFKWPANIAAAFFQIMSSAKYSVLLFTQTETGQKLLNSAYVEAITQPIGQVSATMLDIAKKFINEVGEKVGLNPNLQPTLAQGPEDKESAKLLSKDYVNKLHKMPAEFKRTTDPNNPKIIYIGGVQFTDDQGYQIVPDSAMQRIRDLAKHYPDVGDPTAGIKKKLN